MPSARRVSPVSSQVHVHAAGGCRLVCTARARRCQLMASQPAAVLQIVAPTSIDSVRGASLDDEELVQAKFLLMQVAESRGPAGTSAVATQAGCRSLRGNAPDGALRPVLAGCCRQHAPPRWSGVIKSGSISSTGGGCCVISPPVLCSDALSESALLPDTGAVEGGGTGSNRITPLSLLCVAPASAHCQPALSPTGR
jgi:hypothetical protein